MEPTSITALHTIFFMAKEDSSATICCARGRHYGRSGGRGTKLATAAGFPAHRFLTLPNDERQNR